MSPHASSSRVMSQRTSSSGMARWTGCSPPGSANAPAMYWSPSDRTGASSDDPQMRQVVRVVRLVRGGRGRSTGKSLLPGGCDDAVHGLGEGGVVGDQRNAVPIGPLLRHPPEAGHDDGAIVEEATLHHVRGPALDIGEHERVRGDDPAVEVLVGEV